MTFVPPIIIAEVSGPGFYILLLLVLSSFALGIINVMLTLRTRAEIRSKQAGTAAPITHSPSPAVATVPPAKIEQPSPAPIAPSAPVSGTENIEAPIITLIAAAVHAALDGQPHRILHMEPVSGGWAREGRREIFSSRRVR